MSLISRLRGRTERPARPNTAVLACLPTGWRVDAAVPFDSDGLHWLLACERGLVCAIAIADAEGSGGSSSSPLPVVTGWDEISKASWDAESRAFSFQLLRETQARVVSVPPLLRRTEADGRSEVFSVDEDRFGKVMRQRVERAIVHYVHHTVGEGVRVTLSVRRKGDGSLYVVSEPSLDSGLLEECEEQVRALSRALARDVGITTA